MWLTTALWLAAALPDPYFPLRAGDYDTAISLFRQSLAANPKAVHLHKDLAYTLLKVGEAAAARNEFEEAMKLDPSDAHVALEFAFLANDTSMQREARLIFDRIRHSGDPASRATAEQAFENVDGPLAEGIARWQQALAGNPDNFSAHEELARLAETRSDWRLAADQFEAAYRIKPAERRLLIDLGRAWQHTSRPEDSLAALLAASRSPDPRVSETSRGLLPKRYPYVYEFHRALSLDPKNIELRRELAFLHLEMGDYAKAKEEFENVLKDAPQDPLSRAQLALLQSKLQAKTLRDRPQPQSDDRALGMKSLESGYLKDAVHYLASAYEANPGDSALALKLGWAHNMLHEDHEALRFFDQARHSEDAAIASEAQKAYDNLRPQFARVRTTVWMMPFFSSRWMDAFSYGQVKTEFRIPGFSLFRPYLSVRFAGDVRGTTSSPYPQYLSETAFIPGAGVATPVWRGLMGWAEAGMAVSYLKRSDQTSRTRSDYRGGVSYGKSLGGVERAWFYENHEDGVFVSRFGNTFITYSQNKAGYSMSRILKFYWNVNLTMDAKRQYWANFAESGPGVRVSHNKTVFSLDFVRGVYLVNESNPRRPNFWDFRAGVWYAFTH